MHKPVSSTECLWENTWLDPPLGGGTDRNLSITTSSASGGSEWGREGTKKHKWLNPATKLEYHLNFPASTSQHMMLLPISLCNKKNPLSWCATFVLKIFQCFPTQLFSLFLSVFVWAKVHQATNESIYHFLNVCECGALYRPQKANPIVQEEKEWNYVSPVVGLKLQIQV